MNKRDLARSLARKSHRSRAKAADDVDSLVHRLLKDWKRTRPADESKESSAADLMPQRASNEP